MKWRFNNPPFSAPATAVAAGGQDVEGQAMRLRRACAVLLSSITIIIIIIIIITSTTVIITTLS